MDYQFRTIIIPAQTAPAARALAAALDAAGVGMWTTPLSPTGQLPATHFISSGMLGTTFVDLLPLNDPELPQSPGMPEFVATMASQVGIDITEEQVTALFTVADSTCQDPHQAMARLGLQIISETTGENE